MLALVSFRSLWSVSKAGSPRFGVKFDRSNKVSLLLVLIYIVDDGDDQLSKYVVVSFIEVDR